MRRVKNKVTLQQAADRLKAYAKKKGLGPHKAAWLAEVIWPDTNWVAPQGAGASAVRVLRKLGCTWGSSQSGLNYGWFINTKPRRFINVGGFDDSTKWIEPGFIVTGRGRRKPCKFYTLDRCLKWVKEGDWKELP